MKTRASESRLGSRCAVGACLCALATLVVTLAPFDLRPQPGLVTPGDYLAHFFAGGSTLDDVLNNTLLFVPFGFLLACALRPAFARAALLLAMVSGAAAALALAIELTQLFLPSRVAAPLDVVANTAGAGLGVASLLTAELWLRSPASLLAGLGLYLGLAVAVAAALQPGTSLASWDPSYRLVVGNEANGRRPWRGYVAELRAADLALGPAGARQLLAAGSTPAFAARLVFDYPLAGPAGLVDASGQAPELVWRHQAPAHETHGGVRLDEQHWLWSAAPMAAATEAFRAGSAFTLAATVASAGPGQDGPARIISLSHNNSFRNLTIGQDGPDLVVRLRTGSNGANGRYQQLIVANALADTTPRRLVLTYGGARLTLYLAGHPPVSMALNPEVSLLRQLLAGDLRAGLEELPRGLVNGAGYLLYYGGLFVPLGLALACAAHLGGGPAPWLVAALCAAALPVLLELTLALVGARSPRPLPALGGAALTIGALLWFGARSRRWSPSSAPALEV